MGFYKTTPGRDPAETVGVLITCNCGSDEHQASFSYFPDDEWPELFLSFRLTTYRNLFKRAWVALRYVAGYRCRYGEWDELGMSPRDARKLAEFLLEYAESATKLLELPPSD